MRFPATTLLSALLLLAGLSACGGGGGGGGATPSALPAWSAPVTLDEQQSLTIGALVSDGAGAAAVFWRRGVADGNGAILPELAGARLQADGRWAGPTAIQPAAPGKAYGLPAVAVDRLGKGWVMWLTESVPNGQSTVMEGAPINLRGASPWGTVDKAYILPGTGYSNLRLATGSDGSARAAWSQPVSGAAPLVATSAFNTTSGVWGQVSNPGGSHGAGMSLAGLVGDGLGGYALELYRANDQPAAEGYAYAPGTGVETMVPGWEPAAQSGLPSHTTAWAADSQGSLEAWLVYDLGMTPFREAWPRHRNAQGTWTVGASVGLPRPAETLTVFREASGAGWLAGSGSEGLWVAPLNGVTPGAAHLLVAAPSLATNLVGVRDASGRPALLWIQRRNGTVEGLGFSYLTGGSWTTSTLLPGTAGSDPRNLQAGAGPGGLVAAWEQPGGRTVVLRTALWR